MIPPRRSMLPARIRAALPIFVAGTIVFWIGYAFAQLDRVCALASLK